MLASITPHRTPAAMHSLSSANRNVYPGVPPVFGRAPRRYVALPQEQVTVRPPPAAPEPPSVASVPSGPLSVLGRILIDLLAALNILATLAKILGSLGSAATYVYALRKHEQAIRQRVDSYHLYIAECRRKLATLRDTQREAALISNCDVAECLARAGSLDSRLWERSPEDPDFLHVRLGVAQLEASFKVVLPNVDEPLASDPLWIDAQNLAAEFARVDNVPLVVPLAQIGTVGVIGERQRRREIVRAMLVQMATHHAPSDLKLVVIFPDSEREAWAWVRWLPHVWSDDQTNRYIAARPQEALTVLSMLEDELRYREQVPGALDNAPHLVCVFADPDLVRGADATRADSLIQLLQTRGPTLRTYTLSLEDRARKEWHAIVDLTGREGCLRLVSPPATETCFTPDVVDSDTADRFARRLAPVRLEGARRPLPAVVPLLDVLGVDRVDDLRVANRWRRSAPFDLAAPIGVLPGGRILRLDIHERGHGPHGLLAGSPASGKSEFLRSLIVSLAVHFHPHEVGFLLIEYRPGRLADSFASLPHLVDGLTASSAAEAAHAQHALLTERKRREYLFDQVGVQHIDEYLRLQRQGQVPASLPHLLIIVDGFAEVVQDQPDLAHELVSMLSLSNDLGFHLLLATHKPSVLRNEDIVSNVRYRVCFRLERPEDSQEMLDHSGAAALHHAGRAYFRVGQNELFQQFQTAWGGAQYEPGQRADSGAIIATVHLDGTRHPVEPRATHATQTQLEALIDHLKRVAEQAGIQRLAGPHVAAGGGTNISPVGNGTA